MTACVRTMQTIKRGVGKVRTAVVALGVCIVFTLSWWIVIRRKKPLEHVVLAAVVIFGFLCNLVMVPGIIPDETAHIQTAYRYSNLLLFQPYATENGDILVRREDAPLSHFSDYTPVKASAWSEMAAEWRFFCSAEGTELVAEPGRDVKTGFISYVPGAVGIALGRILHLGTWPMIYLARMCNLLAYALLLYWAVRVTPVKKFMFLLLGLTPMGMQLAGSLSYDVPMIGLGFLFTAYLFRLIYVTEKIGWREWISCCVMAFLLFPCKFVYCTLLLLTLLIAPQKFGGRWKKTLFVSCVALSGLGSLVVSNLPEIAKYLNDLNVMTSAENSRNMELYTLGWLVSHPGETAKILLQTVRQDFDFFWMNMLGGRLSVFNPAVNWLLILLVTLVMAAMKTPEDSLEIPFRHRLVCLGAFLLTFIGTLIIMLVGFTPFGYGVIEGVQGRYFLPVLPLLFVFLGSKHITINGDAQRWLTTLVITCNAASLLEILMWILQH